MQEICFGVDSDQAAVLPDYAANIPTSALKNVGNSLIRAIKEDMMVSFHMVLWSIWDFLTVV